MMLEGLCEKYVTRDQRGSRIVFKRCHVSIRFTRHCKKFGIGEFRAILPLSWASTAGDVTVL